MDNCLDELRKRPYPTKPFELTSLTSIGKESFEKNKDKYPKIRDAEERYLVQWKKVWFINHRDYYWLCDMRKMVIADKNTEALTKLSRYLMAYEDTT